MMSLVDYASSSDGDDCEETQNGASPLQHRSVNLNQHETRPCPASLSARNSTNLLHGGASDEPCAEPPIRLPNAAELLGSLEETTILKHCNASYASSSKKRPATNGPGSVKRHGKLLKGNLPASKIPPDTSGGLLIPPQLKGRSNVVTEDIEKLFARKSKGEEHDTGSSVSVQDA